MLENRNFLIAIVLSIAVLFAWQFFVTGPQVDKMRQQQAAEEQVQQQAAGDSAAGTGAATTTTAPATSAAPAAGGAVLTRDAALALSARVPIESGALSGSINLTGARLDDLHLNDFHETVDDSSPTIVLLSPERGPEAYYADFGWVGENAGPLPDRDTVWTAPQGARLTPSTPVTLTYDNGAGLTFKRTIALDDKYMFTLTDTVANNGGSAVSLAPFGRVNRIGPWYDPRKKAEEPEPPQLAGSWILHEGLIGVTDKLQEWKYKSVRDDGAETWDNVTQGWLGFTDKYWAATLVPDQEKPFSGRFGYTAGDRPAYYADFHGAATTLQPGATLTTTDRLFAGAKQVAIVDKYADDLHIKLFDRLIDWGWFWFFTKPLFYVIDWFFHLFGNFGLAILAVTVLVKALFFPLANRSYRSMSAMKKVQPQMQALREQYKDDKVKQQQELMELYKREKINPLAGCWPMAIQIPVFFSLYKVLFITIEMRHAPFFGWIQDLSAPDPSHIFNLFGLLPYDPALVPVIGGFLAIGVWPLIMGITMFVQMRLNPPPPDPAQAMIFTWMPVIFTFMLASFPAGLVIYWAWNNTLSVTQQYIIMRRSGAEVDLWGNILESLGLRAKKAQPATVPAAANDAGPALRPKPVMDAGGKKKTAKTSKPGKG